MFCIYKPTLYHMNRAVGSYIVTANFLEILSLIHLEIRLIIVVNLVEHESLSNV